MRFAATVRDDAIVVQHLTKNSDRTHFSSISEPSWSKILSYRYSNLIDSELDDNFADRYGTRWRLSKRNQPTAQIFPVEEVTTLNIDPERKLLYL